LKLALAVTVGWLGWVYHDGWERWGLDGGGAGGSGGHVELPPRRKQPSLPVSLEVHPAACQSAADRFEVVDQSWREGGKARPGGAVFF
jgi:hypothetical protein